MTIGCFRCNGPVTDAAVFCEACQAALERKLTDVAGLNMVAALKMYGALVMIRTVVDEALRDMPDPRD